MKEYKTCRFVSRTAKNEVFITPAKEKLFKLVYDVPCESELEGQPGSCLHRRHGLCGEVLKLPYCAVANIVENLISADVVEVVRCKDCKRSGLYAFGLGDCGKVLACLEIEEDGFVRTATEVDPYDFCSHGERREEMRLIDADFVYELHGNYPMFARSQADLTDLRDILDEAPTIESEPVKHGRWLYEAHKENANYRWNVTAECSECCDNRKEIWAGFFPNVPDWLARDIALQDAKQVKLDNYCPNCGAKMDLEE